MCIVTVTQNTQVHYLGKVVKFLAIEERILCFKSQTIYWHVKKQVLNSYGLYRLKVS